MLFGFLSAAMCIAFAFMPITIGTLLAAGLLLTSSSLFIASAQSGLAATLGHQHAMSGQISAAWNVFTALPAVAAYLVEGRLSQMLEGDGPEATCRVFFLIGAASSLLLGCFAFFKPASVYANVRREHGPGSHPFADLMRLARHRGVYPALLIWLLWNFSPGSITPLQYHLQNTLGAADWEWGVWNAIYTASFIPTFVAFGVLCRWFPLKTLLFWGTLVAIPQLIPLLFIGSVNAALIAAAPIGLMGGVATGAYLDLIIRSCPPGLEGTTLMFAGALYFISTRSGDMLGTYLYDNLGGFTPCVLAGAAVYAMILPSLRMVPENLVSTVEPR
jgi:Na+/melibiose symporter-like transporter